MDSAEAELGWLNPRSAEGWLDSIRVSFSFASSWWMLG